MDDNTTKIIKERFDSLPESIQEVILSSDYENTLLKLGQDHNLNVEQLGILERETTLVMMGLTNPDKFESELRHELNIDPQKVNELTKEINEKIFLKIRELLKLMNTPEGEDPVVEELTPTTSRLERVTQEKTDNEILESHGIKIVPAEHIVEKKVENPIPQEEKLEITGAVTPMLAQKLSGSIQTEVKQTEHTLENITKTVPPPMPPEHKSYPPKADPYRELPE